MPSPSMLQKLPLHVVQILVSFVVDRCRSEMGDINTYSKEYVMLLRPLLWVCHNIRAVAHLLYFSYYNLVHITYAFDGDVGQFIQLARQNSQTLECLVFESGADADLCRLIRDVDGGLVTFPLLQILKVDGVSNTPLLPRPVFPGVVPFPSLQIIRVNTCYAFGDDTLFRGNAATLRTLELIVDPVTKAMIRRYRVFSPDSHPKLQCVAIRVIGDGNGPFAFATATDYIRFTLDISPRVTTLVFETGFSCAEFLSVLMPRGNYAFIQHLTLHCTQLTFADAITLIKSLPLLSVLCARYPVIGPIPNDVAIINLPTYVCAKYAPMRTRFRYWRLSYYMGLAGEFEAAVCVLMLALVCPNFDFVLPNNLVIKSFKAQLELVIGVWRVEEHEPRLRRLLNHLSSSN